MYIVYIFYMYMFYMYIFYMHTKLHHPGAFLKRFRLPRGKTEKFPGALRTPHRGAENGGPGDLRLVGKSGSLSWQ